MENQYLIFTDLDGTLLDHHTYSFQPAVEMLGKLKDANIPVIPNTSKTFAELIFFRQQTKLNTPFIVENGAAVFIPIGFVKEQPAGTERFERYWVKSFSKSREHWLSLLNTLPAELQNCYIGFSAMNNEQLCNETGLNAPAALNANSRLYSEPLKWNGTDEQKQQIKTLLTDAGANVLQGGRFLHVSGHSDKGEAMLWLTEFLSSLVSATTKNTTYTTVALGDSYNDNEMLEVADIAVQIKSHKHDFPTLTRTANVVQSTQFGPTGWTECLAKIIKFPKELHHG
jgi:mannosyl-3-phosphoglycerate phosphatase